jgi:hypothetical protein
MKIMKEEFLIIINYGIFVYGKNEFNEVKMPTSVFLCAVVLVIDVCFQMFP